MKINNHPIKNKILPSFSQDTEIKKMNYLIISISFDLVSALAESSSSFLRVITRSGKLPKDYLHVDPQHLKIHSSHGPHRSHCEYKPVTLEMR